MRCRLSSGSLLRRRRDQDRSRLFSTSYNIERTNSRSYVITSMSLLQFQLLLDMLREAFWRRLHNPVEILLSLDQLCVPELLGEIDMVAGFRD